MTTKRTPIDRGRRRVITPGAVEAFRKMLDAETRDEWRDHHSVLHRELAAKPWEWPCVEYPDAENPYPPGTHLHGRWIKEREANPAPRELFNELLALVEESERSAKRKRRARK